MVHTKIFLHKSNGSLKEIRRFNFLNDVTWFDFCAQMSDIVLGGKDTKEFVFEYEDSDHDMVVLSSAAEWVECLGLGNSYSDVSQPLRLHVKPNKTREQKKKEELVLQPHGFYLEGEGRAPTFPLGNLAATVPAILQKFLPENWQNSPNLIPNWLLPAITPIIPQGCSTEGVDVNIPAIAHCLNAQAMALFNEKKFAEALELLKDSFEIQPNYIKLYNMACCESSMNNLTEAIKFLREAVQKGYSNVAHLLLDEDLKPLHDLPEFQSLVDRLAADTEQHNQAISQSESAAEAILQETLANSTSESQPAPAMPTASQATVNQQFPQIAVSAITQAINALQQTLFRPLASPSQTAQSRSFFTTMMPMPSVPVPVVPVPVAPVPVTVATFSTAPVTVEVPIPVQTVPAPVPVPTEAEITEENLRKLQDMGFHGDERIRALLTKHKQSIELVVEDLTA